jgi:predicted CXXCH cytochrome family protein
MKLLSFVSTALAGFLLFCHPAQAAQAPSCVTTDCHASIKALKLPHAPVKDGDCLTCHTQKNQQHPVKGGKSFDLAAKGSALCKECHDGLDKKKVVHQPVKDGECSGCHKPHGSNESFLLEVGEDRTQLCLGCHDGAPFKAKFMHGPAAVGSCNTCHDPHQSLEKGLIKGTVREVCLKCHADFNQLMKQAAVVHPPVADDPCTTCHDPHGSPVPMFLKNKSPDLCMDCHKAIGKTVASVKVPHKPVVSEGGCSNCHSAHFGKAKGLLAAEQMAVCFSCHGKDDLGKAEDKPGLKNIKKQIEGKKFLHGPIQKGDCKACHDPHGSDHFRLLRGGYPAALYVPYKDGAYDACLKCHEKNLLRFPETTIYTKFRNGNRNLHYLHVVSRKGRTCRICHEPHASNGEKLISKEGTEFGDWKIPINFEGSATGGSCAPGCHRKFKYDRVKAEVYSQ